MYLEISPRCSGKTTRLINQVIDDLEQNRYDGALVMAPSMITLNLIERIFRKYLPSYVIRDYIKLSIRYMNVNRNGNVRLYVDEFDLLPSGSFPPLRNGYYTTSIVRQGDMLYTLLKMNNNYYDSFNTFLNINEIINNPSQFNSDFYKTTVPMVRRTLPEIIAQEISSVQPIGDINIPSKDILPDKLFKM